MTSQSRATFILFTVLGISCSDDYGLDDKLITSELRLDSSETLTVRRDDPSMTAIIEYIPSGQIVRGGVELHSYVEYRLVLSQLEKLAPGCPIPCSDDDWQRLEDMRMYPPLALNLFATNKYVQHRQSDGGVRALGRRNTSTSYVGEIVCANPAWGQSGFKKRVEVYGTIELDTKDSDLRVISCDEPGAGPIEANLTVWQYSDE